MFVTKARSLLIPMPQDTPKVNCSIVQLVYRKYSFPFKHAFPSYCSIKVLSSCNASQTGGVFVYNVTGFLTFFSLQNFSTGETCAKCLDKIRYFPMQKIFHIKVIVCGLHTNELRVFSSSDAERIDRVMMEDKGQRLCFEEETFWHTSNRTQFHQRSCSKSVQSCKASWGLSKSVEKSLYCTEPRQGFKRFSVNASFQSMKDFTSPPSFTIVYSLLGFNSWTEITFQHDKLELKSSATDEFLAVNKAPGEFSHVCNQEDEILVVTSEQNQRFKPVPSVRIGLHTRINDPVLYHSRFSSSLLNLPPVHILKGSSSDLNTKRKSLKKRADIFFLGGGGILSTFGQTLHTCSNKLVNSCFFSFSFQ